MSVPHIPTIPSLPASIPDELDMPISPDSLQIDDTENVYNSRIYTIPADGVVIPATVQLPSPNDRRAIILNFGRSLGFQMPTTYSRVRLLDRIRENLERHGYRSEGENTFMRERPLRLIFRRRKGRPSESEPARLPDIVLPGIVSAETFDNQYELRLFVSDNRLDQIIPIGTGRLTRDIARDLREYLTEQGYSVNTKGDFVKTGGVEIKGGFRFNDLFRRQIYVDYLQEDEPITITQNDLIQLNVTLMNIRSRLHTDMWDSIDELASDIGSLLGISPQVVKLVVMSRKLNQENNATTREILTDLQLTGGRSPEERKNTLMDRLRARLNLVPTNYHRRTEFLGPAPTTMTFEEAIQQGYRFGTDRFQEDISELLRYESVPQSYRRFIIELLQYYPGMLDPMRQYSAPSDSLAFALMTLYYPTPPTIVHELYTFAVNFPLVIPESPEKMQRRQALENLPRTYRETLYDIYNSRNLEFILEEDQNPLELYLIAISKLRVNQLSQLARNFGMIVPGHLLNREIRRHILQHMPQYSPIITRPQDTPPINQVIQSRPTGLQDFIQDLERYTDEEIMNHFGYIGGFTTRNDLISNVYEVIREEGFMVFNEINKDLAINEQTVILESIDDLPRPYLAFGTPFSYRVLGLDELLGAFRRERDGFRFQKVGGRLNEDYTIQQVSRLQVLLPSMRDMNGQISEIVEQVLERIRQGIISNIRRNREIDDFIEVVNSRSSEIQELVKSIFYKIFHAGMYMRRWRGPGNRYPTRSNQTMGGWNPQPKVLLALGELSEQMDTLRTSATSLERTIRNLPEIGYNPNSEDITIQTSRIFSQIDRVAQGRACIRMASSRLVVTAFYYLSVVFGEIIPDFDPHSVDPIS